MQDKHGSSALLWDTGSTEDGSALVLVTGKTGCLAAPLEEETEAPEIPRLCSRVSSS